MTGSALFITAYPPWNLGLATGWLALVPVVAAVAGASWLRAGLSGWLFGMVANVGVFGWLLAVPGVQWYHVLLLDAYLALYATVWSIMVGRFVGGSALAQFGVAAAWVVLDYVRSHAGFLGLPWITLSQSQVDNPALLQAARLCGEPAVTFLVVLGNLAIWNVLRGRRASYGWLCALPVLGAMTLGSLVLSSSGPDAGPRVRVGALGTEFPARTTPPPDLQARLDSQIEALEQSLPPDVEIIALPESALINPGLFPLQMGKLQRLAKQQHVTVIAGVAESTKFDHPAADFLPAPPKLRSGAWIITPDRDAPLKHEKSRLVPFAEAMPLRRWITWPTWLIPPLPEVIQGPTPRSHPVPGPVRLGIMICWESLFAEHARALVTDDATLLVMLANEAWFGPSAAGAQHNLTARMRAVETHRSVLVASNMGPPLVIDPFGRVIGSRSGSSPSAPGIHWAAAAVPVVTERSLYTWLGDVFIVPCGVVLLAWLVRGGGDRP